MADELKFSVRRAEKKDIPDLMEMKTRLLLHMKKNNKYLWGISKDFIKNLQPYYEYQIDNPDVCLLIAYEEDTGAVIGMSMGKIKFHEEYDPHVSGRIDDVWGEPMLRRHGVCEVMFSELINFFKERGISALVLEYAIYNKEAEITWSRLGFRPSLIISTANIDEVKTD
jgi:ribosomal protein S18 acetylase RimI-like enzyme